MLKALLKELALSFYIWNSYLYVQILVLPKTIIQQNNSAAEK